MFSILYSLTGALLSLLIMLLAKKVFKLGILGVSILGGVFHNVGQLLVAIAVVSNLRIAYLFPYLLLSGVITGAIIGFIASMTVPYLKKIL